MNVVRHPAATDAKNPAEGKQHAEGQQRTEGQAARDVGDRPPVAPVGEVPREAGRTTMQDLTLVGVHEDGEHVLLTAADGQRFRLRVDEPLRAAVRRDRPRLGRLQLELDGKIRPRDIQARIRAGQTAEEIADLSGLPLEHVQRFEGPVLAEREHVAEQARRVPMRRTAGVLSVSGSAPTLDEVVSERLSRRDVDPFSSSWDAWRTEDRGWVVKLSFDAGGRPRHAHWAYDMNLRHLTPQDDEARWLTEAEPPEPAAASGQRRLAPVRDRVFDVDGPPAHQPSHDAPAPVDFDALRARRGRRVAEVDREVAADPFDQAAHTQTRVETRVETRPDPRGDSRPDPRGDSRADSRAGLRVDPRPARPEPPADPADIDLVLLREDEPSLPRRATVPIPPEREPGLAPEVAVETPAPPRPARPSMPPVETPVPAAEPAARPDPVPATTARPAAKVGKTAPGPAKPHPGSRTRRPAATQRQEPEAPQERMSREPARTAVAEPAEPQPPVQEEQPAPKPARPAAKKKTRASVPSWDDIVFGGRRE